MTKTILDEVPESLRLQVLVDSADSIEETTYYKQLTQEELDAKREIFFSNAEKMDTLNEELADIKANFKDKLKPISSEQKTLLQQVRTKQEEILGKLFHCANHDTGYMETYNESGELISTRRLRPNERQRSILSISKSVNE